jgi:serine/threonine protein kinase/Tol biopolymer transport system component
VLAEAYNRVRLVSMSLSAGTRLGSYEIVAPIGSGAMGEVYRARDLKLDRLVAIKVLPASVANDPDRLRRFEREAKAVAALSHPNILAIHDFGVVDGTAYAATELLKGETLRQRLTSGALPAVKAIDIATHIARGLAAAHDKGIVHRDLKPENVFLTREGHVKILDFGLAKQPSTSIGGDDHTQLATEPGMVLGTVGYMAPEQVRGEPVDARADLFACGTVLYEMLAGVRAFHRDTPAEVMTAILKDDPPTLGTRRDLPSPLERVVRHALEKDANDRFQSARDFAFDLQSIGQMVGSGQIAPATASRFGAFHGREVLAWALLAAVLIAAVVHVRRNGASGAPAGIVNLTLNDEADLSPSAPSQAVGLLVSPDGSRLFFQGPYGDRRLFMRMLDQSASTPLPNTDLGRVLFISPDGGWIGYSTLTNLKRVTLGDGTVVPICQTETITTSGAVSADGQVVFSMGLALWIVPAHGGTPRPLTVLVQPEQAQAVSGFLPDGKTLLFTNWLADHPRIEALTLASGTRRVIVDPGSGGQYVSTGHLLFSRDGTLLVAPFDLAGLEAGSPSRVLDHVRTNVFGLPLLGVSKDGRILAYAEPARTSLVWVTRTGLETALDVPSRSYAFVRISPDSRRVAVADEASVWVADLARGGTARVSSERFIYGSMDWSPGGDQLSYAALYDLVTRAVDGTAAPHRLGVDLRVRKMGPSWSPDGKMIAYSAYFGATNSDIYVEPADGSVSPRPFVVTPAYDAGPQFSPDGRFLAYASSETGQLEVYVTPFPGPGPRWQVSTNGGTHARWSSSGRELFYRHSDEMMAVPITTTPGFSPGRPVLLFRGRYSFGSSIGQPTYDVAADGRFLMIKNQDENLEHPRIIINWSESLKRLMGGS